MSDMPVSSYDDLSKVVEDVLRLPDVAEGASSLYSSLEDFTNKVEIYRGRHSVVWSAVYRPTRKPAVVKAYMKAKMTERNFQQVRREISLMQRVSHAGAVQLLGTFEDLNAIYLVQETCSKGDLFKKLIKNGSMLEEKFVASEVVVPLLRTLEYLHANNIVHRDIKPENIFFTAEGALRLGDFGLAIDWTAERPKSRVGTLDYMAPEVVSLPSSEERKKTSDSQGSDTGSPCSSCQYDEKVDVWAVGILAYELLAGRPPFEVEDEKETARRIMNDHSLSFPAHMSQGSIKFVRAALAKDPRQRPGATELLSHPWLRPYMSVTHMSNLPNGLRRAEAMGSMLKPKLEGDHLPMLSCQSAPASPVNKGSPASSPPSNVSPNGMQPGSSGNGYGTSRYSTKAVLEERAERSESYSGRAPTMQQEAPVHKVERSVESFAGRAPTMQELWGSIQPAASTQSATGSSPLFKYKSLDPAGVSSGARTHVVGRTKSRLANGNTNSQLQTCQEEETAGISAGVAKSRLKEYFVSRKPAGDNC